MYEKVIYEDAEKGHQIRLTISLFREVYYIHLRKYYQDYEDVWLPTKDGISMPANIVNTYNLLDGMLEICSKSEGSDSLYKHVQEKLCKND